IKAKELNEKGELVPCKGQLFYRGIDVTSLTDGFMRDNRFGFEETVYLLLFSKLPNKRELKDFCDLLSSLRYLPQYFFRDMIMKAPGNDMMNIIARSVLALYAYDPNPDDISVQNVLSQCLYLISVFPLLSVYSYQSFEHFFNENSLNIHNPDPSLSTSQNILHILRGKDNYSDLEAKILDLALVLHAEHGGGNNSTFATHVVTSSGTDTYSAIAAALGSLKGPRHGGANIKVVKMFEDMKNSINTKDKSQIKDYLAKLLDKQAFDGSGLIYGMGHAIYSVSDPRSEVLKVCAQKLAQEKGYDDEYELYQTVSVLAPQIISSKRKMYKGVSANVDFYSGLVYKMLELPGELYTPIFAMSRIAGWSAHRIEEIQNNGKIIRPTYVSVKNNQDYKFLSER
ncbi:MAG: citrate synthase, partial [Clostridia bacterium]|nr:citrate synthase [Clostridia bacterium]